jgi:hypothetical protein
MTEAIYALLKRDAELLSKVPPGQTHRLLCCMTRRCIDDIVRANTGPSNRRLLPIQLPLFILVHPNDSICLRVYSIMEISPPH